MTDNTAQAVKTAAANVEAAAKADVSQARTEERGWIAANPHTAVLIAFGAGFVACGVLALVL